MKPVELSVQKVTYMYGRYGKKCRLFQRGLRRTQHQRPRNIVLLLDMRVVLIAIHKPIYSFHIIFKLKKLQLL